MSATNNFSKVLGEGSFGVVYYGKLPNGQEVAVKKVVYYFTSRSYGVFSLRYVYIYITKTIKLLQIFT
jgi:hypothetical protein